MASVGSVSSAPTENQYLQEQMSAQAPNTSVNLSGLFPGNSSLQSIANQLQTAQNAANTANQTRYKDILGLYSNMGTSSAQQIQQQTQQNQAQNTQDMTSRGLGNTTLTSAMSNQINSMGQMNQLNLQDTLSGQEANAMMQMNQNAPNIGQYASLLQAAANQPRPGQVTSGNNGSIGGPVGFGPSTYTNTNASQGGTTFGSDYSQPSYSSPSSSSSSYGGGGGNDFSGGSSSMTPFTGWPSSGTTSDTQGSQWDESSDWE